ncbi:hypothetical protein RYH80_09590 [Halobaculum sp. MBLA0147]|uniref:DUF7266 family protein n=1 Tax=Halobaculum sp. MBLA0147 TaxID=3079934 RepID=UPI00352356A8
MSEASRRTRSDSDESGPSRLVRRSFERSTDTRGVTPTVGKTLEIGVALLVVSGLVVTLHGSVVPEYRSRVGDAVAERTLVGAAHHVRDAVPHSAHRSRVVRRVPLPATIRGTTYEVVVEDRRLRLVHPNPGVEAVWTPVLPPSVDSFEGSWRSDRPASVVVTTTRDEVAVRLEHGDESTGPAVAAVGRRAQAALPVVQSNGDPDRRPRRRRVGGDRV